MKAEQYRVTVVYMSGNVTQEIVWAVDKKHARETVQMELPETADVHSISVEALTKRELDELERI